MDRERVLGAAGLGFRYGVCIFNLTHEKSECNKQLITTVSSQNQNLTVKTVNNKMFIPQARFGDLLWSGVGNANFGKPRTYLR